MSHFYGSVQGNRGEVTRGGSKNSGYTAVAASWSGAVKVELYYNEAYEQDWCEVYLTTWKGAGKNALLYRGPVDGSPHPLTQDGIKELNNE